MSIKKTQGTQKSMMAQLHDLLGFHCLGGFHWEIQDIELYIYYNFIENCLISSYLIENL